MVAVQHECPDFCLEMRYGGSLKPAIHGSYCSGDMQKEVRQILEETPVNQRLITEIDTTFDIGPYCVTRYSMQHPMLERRVLSSNQINSEPTIPVSYEIHERRGKKDHPRFLENNFEAIDAPYAEDDLRTLKKDLHLSQKDVEDADKDLRLLMSSEVR